MDKAREGFLRRRRTGVGGSDVGPILAVDRYRTVLDVYLDKMGENEQEETGPMIRGRMLEGVVADLYVEKTGRRLKPGKFRKHLDPKLDFLVGNPDRIIVATGKAPYHNLRDGAGVLECKTANRYVFERMKREGLPQSYVLQLHHYLGVCGVKWGAFAVLCTDPWEFTTFEVDYDHDLYLQVAEVLRVFWFENVKKKELPLVRAVDWTDAPEVPDDEVIAQMDTDEWTEAVEYLREAKALKKSAAGMEELARQTVTHVMDESFGHGVYEGAGARIYYREQKGRTSFDKKSLAALAPLDRIRMGGLLEEAGLSLEVIEKLFEEATLDLTKFEKQGKPFSTVKLYDSRDPA